MSSYAIPADIATVIAAAAISGFSDAEKQSAIYEASSLADSYLASRFRLPLVAWDRGLTLAVCQMSVELLMQRRGYNPESGSDQSIAAAADRARLWLRDVSSGKVTPVVTDTAPAASSVSRVYSSTPRGW